MGQASDEELRRQQAKRLREARIAAGYADGTVAAAALGVSRDTYYQHENGTRGFKSSAERYALKFRTSPEWLLWGRQGDTQRRFIPVVGYVGAASEFFGFDDHAKGAGMDEIEAPPGVPESAVAVIVRGDSGYPAIRDGMVLIYWNCLRDPSSIEGEDCFVRLDDGRTLVKILERGTEAGHWTLRSINESTPPIRNITIEWAAPIEIRLRRMNWRGA